MKIKQLIPILLAFTSFCAAAAVVDRIEELPDTNRQIETMKMANKALEDVLASDLKDQKKLIKTQKDFVQAVFCVRQAYNSVFAKARLEELSMWVLTDEGKINQLKVFSVLLGANKGSFTPKEESCPKNS